MKWIFSIFFLSLFSPCSLGMTGEFFFSVVSQHLGWVQHLGVRRRRGKRKKKGEGEPEEGKMKWIFSIFFFLGSF